MAIMERKAMLNVATAILLGSSLLVTCFDSCASQFPAPTESSNRVFTPNPEHGGPQTPAHVAPIGCSTRVAEVQATGAPPLPDLATLTSRFDWETNPMEYPTFGLGGVLSYSIAGARQLVLRI
jgi:hypothetical protein